MNKKEISSKRLLAALIDQLIVSFIAAALGALIAFAFILVKGLNLNYEYAELQLEEIAKAIMITSSIVGVVLTFVWFTIIPFLNKSRATVGKIIMGLKVIKQDDTLPGFKELLIRNIRLYIEIPALIITVLAGLNIKGTEFLSGAISFIQVIMYFYVIVTIAGKKEVFYDSIAKTMIVEKLYDPNLANYQTVEEVKDWADVKGLYEQKNNQASDVEFKDPDIEKDINEKDYWD